MNKKTHIAILGATGFIGSHIAKQLHSEGYFLTILKRSTSDTKRIEFLLPNVKSIDIDKANLETILKKEKIDIFINFVTHYGRSITDKKSDLFYTNVVFPLQIIEALEKNTLSVYMNIDTLLNHKTSVYAYSKFILSNLLKNYIQLPFQIFNIKLSYVCGKDDDTTKFLPFAIHSLQNNLDIEMTKGEQKIDFIDIRDVSAALSFLIRKREDYSKHFEEFEIGTGKSRTLFEVIKMFKNQLRSRSLIKRVKNYRENEPMEVIANNRRLLPWKPKHSIENFIVDTYEL